MKIVHAAEVHGFLSSNYPFGAHFVNCLSLSAHLVPLGYTTTYDPTAEGHLQPLNRTLPIQNETEAAYIVAEPQQGPDKIWGQEAPIVGHQLAPKG